MWRVNNHAAGTGNHGENGQQAAIFSFRQTTTAGDFTDSFPSLRLKVQESAKSSAVVLSLSAPQGIKRAISDEKVLRKAASPSRKCLILKAHCRSFDEAASASAAGFRDINITDQNDINSEVLRPYYLLLLKCKFEKASSSDSVFKQSAFQITLI